MKTEAPPDTGSTLPVDGVHPSAKDEPPVNNEKEEQLKLRNKHLRELREEVRDLADFFGKVKLGLTSVAAGESYIRKTVDDITELFTELEQDNRNSRSDTVRHITNLWEQMQANPVLADPTQALPQQEQLHALTLLEDRAAKIVFAVGQQTIPHRLNNWLDQARTGYYVPFHQLFEDELPDPKERQSVLRNIALAPKALRAGIVSSQNGLVYRYNPSPWGRRLGLFWVSALFLAVTGLVWGLGSQFAATAIPELSLDPQLRPLLLPAWVAILLGIVVHMAVASVKRNRESGLPPVMAVQDWMLMFSARKGDVVVKLFLALIGLFALAFLVSAEQFTVTTAFFVGYSLDSFIGLFGESMDQKASAQLATMRKTSGLDAEA